jgi:hypothetical protein
MIRIYGFLGLAGIDFDAETVSGIEFIDHVVLVDNHFEFLLLF